MGSRFFTPLHEWLLKPRSAQEDDARREYILNVLLAAIAALLLFLSLIVVVNQLSKGAEYTGENPLIVMGSAGVALLLIVVSRAGFFRTSAALLIGLLSAAVFYTNISRGVDLPMSWVFYAMLVFMAGILISIRFAFLFVVAISCAFIGLTHLQATGQNPFFIRDWRTDGLDIPDALGFCVSLGVIYIVSWLSSREIERSLQRARKSEAELMAERDSLEIKVEQRTRELKEAQREHVEQLEQFADFGRLASGILHDLANPLTSMGLNLRMAQSADPETQASLLNRAVIATERMETLVRAARSQVRAQTEPHEFSIADEIEQATELLAYKARKADVHFNLDEVENIRVVGNPYAFSRSICNLIANAIEAYNNPLADELRIVRISASANDQRVFVTVEDRGVGIPPEIMSRIFDPLVTTKGEKGGSGMGLVTTKAIVERDFGGDIQVESTPGEGSRFTIRFPIKRRAV